MTVEFSVYQQLPPIRMDEQDDPLVDWHKANLVEVCKVEAHSAAAAIAKARELPRFARRSKSTLMAFPIVHDPRGVPDDIQ